jgi:hypothetical protein
MYVDMSGKNMKEYFVTEQNNVRARDIPKSLLCFSLLELIYRFYDNFVSLFI